MQFSSRTSAAKAVQISADANTLGAYIANSACAGHVAEARQAAGRLLKLEPDFRASHGREALPSRSPEETNCALRLTRADPQPTLVPQVLLGHACQTLRKSAGASSRSSRQMLR